MTVRQILSRLQASTRGHIVVADPAQNKALNMFFLDYAKEGHDDPSDAREYMGDYRKMAKVFVKEVTTDPKLKKLVDSFVEYISDKSAARNLRDQLAAYQDGETSRLPGPKTFHPILRNILLQFDDMGDW